jgi:hypothetical protein
MVSSTFFHLKNYNASFLSIGKQLKSIQNVTLSKLERAIDDRVYREHQTPISHQLNFAMIVLGKRCMIYQQF